MNSSGDEHEHEGVGQPLPRALGQVAAQHHLGEAEGEPADDGAGEAAEAADDRRDDGLERGSRSRASARRSGCASGSARRRRRRAARRRRRRRRSPGWRARPSAGRRRSPRCAARTEIPNSVRRNTNAVSASTTAVTAIVTRSMTSKRMPPISTVLNAHAGPGNDFFVGDTKTAHSACDSCSRANDVSSIVNGLALRTQRNATRSMATEASTADDDDRRREHPPADAARRQEVGDVGADGDQLGVGEVDEVHHAEDQRDAERQQGVRAAAAEAVDEVLDAASSRRRPPTKWPKRSSWAASSGPGPSTAIRPVRST